MDIIIRNEGSYSLYSLYNRITPSMTFRSATGVSVYCCAPTCRTAASVVIYTVAVLWSSVFRRLFYLFTERRQAKQGYNFRFKIGGRSQKRKVNIIVIELFNLSNRYIFDISRDVLYFWCHYGNVLWRYLR